MSTTREVLERDDAIVDFITKFCREHGYSPTMREVGQAVGLLSSSRIWERLTFLRDTDRITYVDGQSRTLRAWS